MSIAETLQPAVNKLNQLSYNLKSKKKIVYTFLGILLLASSVGVGTYLVGQKQGTKIGATGPTLSMTPSKSNPKVNEIFNVTIGIDTNGMSVSGADIIVRYPTANLTVQNIQETGSFLPVVFVPGTIELADTASGRARIILGCLTDSTGTYPKNGIGALAQITFLAKATGTAKITFGTSTAIAAVGQSANVVGTMTPLSLSITTASGTPPPTPPPTPTPTVLPPTVPPTSPSASPFPPSNPPTQSPSPSPTSSGGVIGDVNQDGHVNILDIGEIIDHYGQPAVNDPRANLNGDNIINILDLGIVIDHYEL